MKNYKIAINKFINQLENKNDIAGALVCGSFVTGDPTVNSDIDLHLLLSKKTSYKERGNKIVDGFLIEYFMNTKEEILKYFKSDYSKNRTVSYVMFLTGEIIFDKNKEILELKKEAKKYIKKDFFKLKNHEMENYKYAL